MPKGRTNQPLIFMIPEEWRDSPLFKELMEQGHTIINLPPEAIKADIIFGINCHIMTNEMMAQKGMIQVALRAARKRKKKVKNENIDGS